MALIAVAVWWYTARQPEPTPTPPDVELAHVEPMVAAAVKEARNRLDQDLTNGAAWGEYGLSLHGHGFHAQGKACYQTAERLDPANPAWVYLAADCDARLNDKSAAIEGFRRAGFRTNAHPAANLRLGELLLEVGQFDEAERVFKDIHRFAPREPRAHLGLARVELNRNNLRGSLTHVHNCLAQTGDIPLACELLAEVYYQLGERDLATDARRRAGGPTSWVAWPDPYLELLADRQTGVSVIGRRTTALLKVGRYTEAEAMLADLVRREPTSAKAQAWYGRTLVLMNRNEEGERHVREALRLDQNFAEAWFYLGVALANQSRYTEAVAEFKKLIDVQPDHVDANVKLGQCYYILGNKAAAADALAVAVRHMPNDGKAQRNLGIILYELGRYSESVTHLVRAAELLPEDGTIPGLLKQSEKAAGYLPR